MGLMAVQTIDIAVQEVTVLDSTAIELSKMKDEKSISELQETFKWLNMCGI